MSARSRCQPWPFTTYAGDDRLALALPPACAFHPETGTACGRKNWCRLYFTRPILSRPRRRRCPDCCAKLGIRSGDG